MAGGGLINENGYEIETTNKTYAYKILTNEWQELNDLPIKLKASTVVFNEDYFYIFNGQDYRGYNQDLVYRIKPEIGENWEFVGNTKFKSKSPNVLPYNMK